MPSEGKCLMQVIQGHLCDPVQGSVVYSMWVRLTKPSTITQTTIKQIVHMHKKVQETPGQHTSDSLHTQWTCHGHGCHGHGQ